MPCGHRVCLCVTVCVWAKRGQSGPRSPSWSSQSERPLRILPSRVPPPPPPAPWPHRCSGGQGGPAGPRGGAATREIIVHRYTDPGSSRAEAGLLQSGHKVCDVLSVLSVLASGLDRHNTHCLDGQVPENLSSISYSTLTACTPCFNK
jgi:hypothetical protein